MVMLLLPRLRVVFAGRLYIQPLEEAGKNIFQEILVLFRRGFSCIGVINNLCTASSINTRPPHHLVSLVQGQIFAVARHSLNCSFVLFPCTGMLVFKLELVHEVNSRTYCVWDISTCVWEVGLICAWFECLLWAFRITCVSFHSVYKHRDKHWT
jgi:hypothetical protein